MDAPPKMMIAIISACKPSNNYTKLILVDATVKQLGN
jgi:hypothetical protein